MLRFLVSTADDGIFFKRPSTKPKTITIDGYCDSDWGNCPETRKSITSYAMMVAGGPVAWAARRQSEVAQSTAEAEYVASCEACMEGKSLLNVRREAIPEKPVEFTLGVDTKPPSLWLPTRLTAGRSDTSSSVSTTCVSKSRGKQS
jgi:hypothetical protein